MAQGGAFGGWSLYMVDGLLRYCHNLSGLRRFTVSSDVVVPPGVHQLRFEFAPDSAGLGVGGQVTLYTDGVRSGGGRVDATVPLLYSGDETADVGCDRGTPVCDDYPPRANEFSGTIRWLQIEVDPDSQDHLVSPEDRLRVIMGRQ
jgi:arylsulfatase